MAYLVLARKYRPKSFEQLVGQDHVVRALTHALDTQRLHHAYLFTGTRGIGKTTLSRILAKSLNCEKGITSQPCGVCEACRSIDEDRFVDYIEMDAASNRGIGDMLQLLEQAVYAPTAARFKVYMIDEVHMLTTQAFNAMLKTLEEPPEYVKFILATTDPQKIPVTVLSRCLQFNLKQMPQGHIASHLEHILDVEKITYEKPALNLLAKGARGSMRDALSLTDQAIAYTAGHVNLSDVQNMLGALDQTYIIRLIDALAERNGKAILDISHEMAQRSLSYQVALQDLAQVFQQMGWARLVPEAVSDNVSHKDIVRLAELFTDEEIQLAYQICIRGRNELGLAPDEYAGFTMTMMRLLAFLPDEKKNTNLVDASTSLLTDSSTKDTIRNEEESIESKVPMHEEKPQPSVNWDGNWIDLVPQLKLKGISQQLALQAELSTWSVANQTLKIVIKVEKNVIQDKAYIATLQKALERHFGCSVKLDVVAGETKNTIDKQEKLKKARLQSEAEQSISEDKLLKKLAQSLGGHVVPGTIQPTK